MSVSYYEDEMLNAIMITFSMFGIAVVIWLLRVVWQQSEPVILKSGITILLGTALIMIIGFMLEHIRRIVFDLRKSRNNDKVK